MKNSLLNAFCLMFLLLLASCTDSQIKHGDNSNNYDQNPDNPGENTQPKYEKDFLGEWIRMDTGDRWYISGNAITVNGLTFNKFVTLLKTADHVITVKEEGREDYLLFASRVADANFNAQVVFINDKINTNRSLLVNYEIPHLIITNPQQPEQPPVKIIPDPDSGKIEVSRQIPGDQILIVPDDPEWNKIVVGFTPWDEQDMGIIPLSHGVNLKASIRMANTNIDITELYADKTPQDYIIEIENIGDTNCIGASYEIYWREDDFNLISGSLQGTLDTIIPRGKKQIYLTMASNPIVNEYRNKKILVTIVSYNTMTEAIVRWDDTVSVNYYRESVPFRFKSQRPVQGVVRSPRNKTYYFKTSGTEGNCTTTLNLPWLSDDYVVAFLGATVTNQSETKYSIAIDSEPRSDWDSLWGEDMFRYESVNKSTNTAPILTITNNEFMYYLYTGAVQFFKMNLGDGISLNKYHLTLPVGESETLYATVHPKNTADQSVIWATSDPAVAVVDGSGNVNAVSAGTAKITATSVSCNKVSECVVNVYESYTVIFNINGATSGSTPNKTILFTDSGLILPNANNFFKTGYTFEGWNTESDGTGIDYNANIYYIPSDNIILYAKWNVNTYTVKYNTNGGIGEMQNTSFIYGISQNLQNNLFTNYICPFLGWALSPSGPVIYNNGQDVNNLSVIANEIINLYAIWDYSLTGQLTWLKENAASNSIYTITIRNNESISPYTFSYETRNNININIIGINTEQKINLLTTGALFTVDDGVTLTLDNNITLQGIKNNFCSLVIINKGGTLIMNNGARIINNTNDYEASRIVGYLGSGVYNNGYFIMNGGEISGNVARFFTGGGIASAGTFTMNGGKIYGNSSFIDNGGGVSSWGTFIMNDGEISSNTATSTSSGGDGGKGGGVYSTGIFIMNSGRIANNTVTSQGGAGGASQGGGVYSTKTFIMKGGEITGNRATTMENPNSSGVGGGICSIGTFQIVNGVIYGSNASTSQANRANGNNSASLSIYSTAQYGVFNGDTWISNGNLSTTNNTIRVENGVLK